MKRSHWIAYAAGLIAVAALLSAQAINGVPSQVIASVITSLTGDVTTSGAGAAAATVAKIQGTVVSGTTGSGNVAFATSPTFITPILGTPASGNLANTTGYPAATTSTAGIVEPDGTTLCVSAGTISTCTLTGSLTSVQVLGLNTSPVTLLAAQGAGTLIAVDQVVLESVYSTTQYTFSGTVALELGTQIVTGTCASSFLTQTNNRLCVLLAASQATLESNMVNLGLVIFASSSPTLGVGTVNYWVKYRVLSGI